MKDLIWRISCGAYTIIGRAGGAGPGQDLQETPYYGRADPPREHVPLRPPGALLSSRTYSQGYDARLRNVILHQKSLLLPRGLENQHWCPAEAETLIPLSCLCEQKSEGAGRWLPPHFHLPDLHKSRGCQIPFIPRTWAAEEFLGNVAFGFLASAAP